MALNMDVDSTNEQRQLVARRQLDLVKDEMWTEAKDPNNYAPYFAHAPKAVLLVETLLIVGAGMNDPSLINKDRPMTFNYLKSPGSLKACLYQISNEVYETFLFADQCMTKIGIKMRDEIKLFSQVFEFIEKKDTPKPLIDYLLLELKKGMESCHGDAESVCVKFKHSTEVIKELVKASKASQGEFEKNKRDNDKKQKLLREKEERLKQSDAKLQHRLDEQEESLKKAKVALEKQIDNMPSNGAIIFASLLEAATTIVPFHIAPFAATASATVKNVFGGKNAPQNQTPAENSTTEIPFHLNMYMNASFKSMQAAIQQVNLSNINADFTTNFITPIEKTIDCFSDATEPIVINFVNNAKQLIAMLKHLKPELAMNDADKVEMNSVFSKLQDITSKYIKSTEHDKNGTTVPPKTYESEIGAATAMTKNAQARVEEQRKTLESERIEDEQLRAALSESERRISETMNELHALDMENVDFDDMIKVLHNGVHTLTEIEQHWRALAAFFDNIALLISTTMLTTMNRYIGYSHMQFASPNTTIKNEQLKAMLKATGLCLCVEKLTKFYTHISQHHVMPVIGCAGGYIAVDRERAKELKRDLPERMETANREVGDYLRNEMKIYRSEVNSHMDRLHVQYASITNE